MNMPFSIDKYLIVGHQQGLMEIKNNTVVLTEKGYDTMDKITVECLDLMKDVLVSDFDRLIVELSTAYNKSFTRVDVFQLVMLGMVGSEARLLAFLLNEKETNYRALIEAIGETVSLSNKSVPVTNENKVAQFRKKPKFDS